MFFEADRIRAIREMIVSETSEQREKALEKLEPMQQGDFEAIYEAMAIGAERNVPAILEKAGVTAE